MADPRVNTTYQSIVGPEATFIADGSIDLPIFSNGQNLSVSASLSTAVTVTSTSTYAAPDDASILAGYGAAGSRILGQVLVVEPEGMITVQTRGYVYFVPNSGNPPTVGKLVACDGTGKVQSAAGAAQCANAVCLGFVYNHNQESFTHLSGNISVPTSVAQGPEVCLVLLS